jgi:hypothetical protein
MSGARPPSGSCCRQRWRPWGSCRCWPRAASGMGPRSSGRWAGSPGGVAGNQVRGQRRGLHPLGLQATDRPGQGQRPGEGIPIGSFRGPAGELVPWPPGMPSGWRPPTSTATSSTRHCGPASPAAWSTTSNQRQRSSATWSAMPRQPWLAREASPSPLVALTGRRLTRGCLGSSFVHACRRRYAKARTARAVAWNAFHSSQCCDCSRSTLSWSPSTAR